MNGQEDKILQEQISSAREYMDLAITIIDTNESLLCYNDQATKILDRKPEYIAKDVHSQYKKAASNKKFDLMLQEFQSGRAEPF